MRRQRAEVLLAIGVPPVGAAIYVVLLLIGRQRAGRVRDSREKN